MAQTVLFVHGAWLTPSSWDRFRSRFEARGHVTMAPPWPFLDRAVEDLRRAPDPGLAGLTIGSWWLITSARNFAQDLPPNEQREVYQREIVPAPGRLFFQAALHIGDGVRYANAQRAPLLLMAGEKDRTVEASMVRAAFRSYRRSRATTELQSFPDRSHFLINSPGWEEVADAAIDWVGRHTAPARVAGATASG